ncbi:MAG TPA: TIGR02444 family protein [Candidatus Sulfotelmatobacter sp.]|nr:TIGR02444 family protein [Candidatus Sulfotelmatobacter sp.]
MAKPKHRSGRRSPGAAVDRVAAAFWRFSLVLYDRPGVAEAAIRLQDRHGLDVNLLLLCCFVGAAGQGALTRAELAQAERAVRGWRKGVVQPLRALRRALKLPPLAAGDTADGALRRQLLEAELFAEARAQAMLAAWLAGRKRGVSGKVAAAVALSLERYAACAVRLDRADRAALELLATMALA